MRAIVATRVDVDPRVITKPRTIPAYIVWLSPTGTQVLPAHQLRPTDFRYNDTMVVAQAGERWFVVKVKNISSWARADVKVKMLTAFAEQAWPDQNVYDVATWALHSWGEWAARILDRGRRFQTVIKRFSEALDKLRAAANACTANRAIDPSVKIKRYQNYAAADQHSGPSTTAIVELQIAKKSAKFMEVGRKLRGAVYINDPDWRHSRRSDISAIYRLWAEARAGQTYTVHAHDQGAQVTVGSGTGSELGWQMLPIIYEEQIGKQFASSTRVS